MVFARVQRLTISSAAARVQNNAAVGSDGEHQRDQLPLSTYVHVCGAECSARPLWAIWIRLNTGLTGHSAVV